MSKDIFPPADTLYRRKHIINVGHSHPREASYGSVVLSFLNQSGQGTVIQLDPQDLLRTYHVIGEALMAIGSTLMETDPGKDAS